MAWAARIVVCVALVLPGAPLADSHSSIGGPAPKPKAAEKTTPEPNKDKGAFYVVIDGKAVGPIKDQAVRDLIDADKIAPESLVWWDGQKDWVALKDAKQLEPVLKAVYLREAFNAKTYLAGTWSTGDYFGPVEGLGQGRKNDTLTFDFDRNFTEFHRAVGRSNTGTVNSTIWTEGTYTAWLGTNGEMVVVLKGEQTHSSPHLKKGSKTEKIDETIYFDVLDQDRFQLQGTSLVYHRSP